MDAQKAKSWHWPTALGEPDEAAGHAKAVATYACQQQTVQGGDPASLPAAEEAGCSVHFLFCIEFTTIFVIVYQVCRLMNILLRSGFEEPGGQFGKQHGEVSIISGGQCHILLTLLHLALLFSREFEGFG
jgi:hypothetical protein